MNRLILTAIFLLSLLFGEVLWGQDLPTRKIEDDSSLRLSLEASWFRDLPGRVLAKRPELHTLRGGARVEVRVEASGANRDEFAIVLAREENGAYPGWAQGSWVYTRNLSTGAPLRIRAFLRSDPQIFFQLRPLGSDKSQIDVILYDAYVVRGLPVGIPFERLHTMPVEDAITAAGDRFPRRYFDPDPRLYRKINTLVLKIRKELTPLLFIDDGAVDENGNYVYIATLEQQKGAKGLNCSGFTKWVVDGMLRPVTGKRLTIDSLKKPVSPRTSLSANYEALDLLFGLDWTRNLALEASRVLRSPAFATLENVEVRRETFASFIDRSSGRAVTKSYPGFLVGSGFSIEGLRPLLYTLAINEPGHIYLASVNRERGEVPPFRQHYHVAVLVPFFNEFGNFQILVFESAAETNIAGFIGRHPKGNINLVRIPVEGDFLP
jgi:hypothetical protein